MKLKFKKNLRNFSSIKNYTRLINFIPKKLIDELAQRYKTDTYVKKLFADRVLYMLILMNFLKDKYNSYSGRGIAAFSGNILFKIFTGIDRVSKSGLSDALSRINYNFFKEIFEFLLNYSFSKVKKEREKGLKKVKIFDTTIITLSLKLFPWATFTDTRSGVKLGLRIDEQYNIPDKVVIMKGDVGDNVLFKDMVDFLKSGFTYIFDRGFRNFSIFYEIHETKNYFITKTCSSYKYEIVKDIKIDKEYKEVKILNEKYVMIGNEKNKSNYIFRLIEAINTESEEKFSILTNRVDLTSYEILLLYKERWSIEIFFRNLKQVLKIKRFISNKENGCLIQIYVALIVWLLIFLFNQINNMNLTILRGLRCIQNLIINSYGMKMFNYGFLNGFLIRINIKEELKITKFKYLENVK